MPHQPIKPPLLRVVGLAVALLLASSLAASAAPAAPEARAFTLGDATVISVRDATFVAKNDGKTFGVTVGPEKVAEVLKAAGGPPDQIPLDVDALLVKLGGRVLLFDTGLGGVLKGSVVAAGVRPEEVTDIFITHSHFDHVGGLVGPEGLIYPNATIHLSSREWASMQAGSPPSKVAPAIAAKVRTFEPGAPIVPGVKAIALYGHTPGHVAYEITSKGERLVDIGDTAHSSIVSLAHPEWAMQYDQDQAAGAAMRIRTLKELASAHVLIFAPHFPYPGVGVLEAKEVGYVFRPRAP